MDEEILELEEALTGSGAGIDSSAGVDSSESSQVSDTTTSDAIKTEKRDRQRDTREGSSSRPDFRVVQPVVDKDGKNVFVNVGAMWRNVSKNGREFYTLKIGNLRLLVFPQDR